MSLITRNTTSGLLPRLRTISVVVLPNRAKFFFAGHFLETVNPRIPGFPHEGLVTMVGDNPGRVLDLCGGTGYTARLLQRAAPSAEVVCLDLSPELLNVGRQRARAEGLHAIRFVRGNAASLPFREARFDVVVAAFGLHELSYSVRETAIREVARVLRPGGRLAVADLDAPRTWTLAFGAYLRISHGPDAQAVLGSGLRAALMAAGFVIAVHRPSLGSILPFQLLEAYATHGPSQAGPA